MASGSGQPAPAAAAPQPQPQPAAARAKRKQAGNGEIEAAAADARSPAALSRAAVRPRWEQPAAAATAAPGGTTSSVGGAAIGSPAPSPYRLLSPAKAGAAPLNQLPGYHFSKTRRSSAASDVSTAGSSGAGGDGTAASGSSLQPPYRRKLAAPPSRLGGESRSRCRQGCPDGLTKQQQLPHTLTACAMLTWVAHTAHCCCCAGTPGSRGMRARLLPSEPLERVGSLSEFDQLLPGGCCYPWLLPS